MGYEEGESWVISRMRNGYPRFVLLRTCSAQSCCSPAEHRMGRFFIDFCIAKFADLIRDNHGQSWEAAMLFPSSRIAARCVSFMCAQEQTLDSDKVRVMELIADPSKDLDSRIEILAPKICAVLFPKEYFSVAKTFWQHSGDGVSSRRAEFARHAYEQGYLVQKRAPTGKDLGRMCRGPKRYRRDASVDTEIVADGCKASTSNSRSEGRDEYSQFIEERFGRNLDTSLVANAKLAIRRRIAGSLTANVDLAEAIELEDKTDRARTTEGFAVDDVYLYPAGMSSIFNTHSAILKALGPLKSICYG